MAAMVTQGPEAARDVCSHFDLNKKNLYALATKRDSKVSTPKCRASSLTEDGSAAQQSLNPSNI